MRPLLTVLLCTAAASAWAQVPQTTLTQAGYTGLGITPNAHLLGWGRLEFAYDNQLPGIPRDPSGHNYVLGFGLLPNLEIAGRLAANSPQDSNCFVAPGCGVRDLSASAKAGIGLDAAGRFRVAAGITDVGGSVTYFRSYYGVATFNEGPLEVSAGLAQRTGRGINNSRSPLDGPFAAAAWQPMPWVRGQLEYTDGNAWAGVRLFAPKDWLPEGWSAYIGANQRLTGTNLTERAWWSAGISIPLYKVPGLRGSAPQAPLPALAGSQRPLPAYEARTLPPSTSAAPSAASPAPGPVSPPVNDTKLAQLAEVLRAKGLEDLWVGRMGDASIAVRANNATYNWNSLDALGAALAAIAQTLGDTKTAYRLILTQRQVPLVAVTGQADCLSQWLRSEVDACAAGELSTPGTTALDKLHEGANWVVTRRAPSWRTLRVSISPVLRTNVGSEFGVLDYSLGANVSLLLPLWSGASVEARHDVPLTHSSDYEGREIFADRRVRSRLERLAFTQTLRLPLERWIAGNDDVAISRWGLASVVAQGSIGRFGGFYDGVHGALRWEPGNGKHRITAEAGWFEHAEFGTFGSPGPRTAKPALAHYRYHFQPTRTYLEASAGNFMNNDLGMQLGLRQWFGDVAVQVYYRRSHFENAPTRQFVGIQLSVPIGPRRDMNPGWMQVTGTPRFSHGVETTVREDGSNPARTGFGVAPPVRTLDSTFNSDRAGLLYFEDNVRRVRDAARQSLE
jgi:hypothetical protein